jgi:hypothetical protein
LVEQLSSPTSLSSKAHLDELRDGLANLASQTRIKSLQVNAPIPALSLVHTLNQLQTALNPLRGDETAKLLSADGRSVTFNRNLKLDVERLEQLLTDETLAHDQELILRIKKPDFLGESKWEFVLDRAIDAKMQDEIWLTRFRNKEVTVAPGDALRAIVRVHANYDINRELISSRYEVLRVLDVLPFVKPIQGRWE